MTPLKIGIVCYPTVGGSGVIATEMALQLAREGHEIHLLSYDRPSRLRRRSEPGLRYHNVQVSAYPLFRYPPYDLALASCMLEVHEEAGLDLFHVHYAIPHAVSAFLARSMARPEQPIRFVTTLHGTDIFIVGADRPYMRPTRFALEQSDAVTSVSQYLADETSLLFGTRKPIEVVPNFVDTETYVPGSEGRFYDRRDDERIVVHASNFRPVKRVGDVVRGFAKVSRELPARLLLVGDGPDREHAMAVAADEGIADRITHMGSHDGIESILANADLFLLGSETESFGLVLLEAMSCGVPCVSTDVGGVGEVLGDTGARVPVANPDAMAEAALGFLRDADVHREQSRRSRERAVEHFDQRRIVKQYLDVYRQVLDR